MKWTDKIRNEEILHVVNEERQILNTIKSRKINWLGHALRRNCVIKDALEGTVEGKNGKGRRRYQLIDNIKINGSYAGTKLVAQMRQDWRLLNLQ